MKRQRGRGRNNNRNNNHNNHNRALDSNGPDVKVRGTASTIYEKYTALARDAQSSGARVKAENLRQHAEHYLRIMNIQEAAKRAAQEERDAAKAARGDTEDETSDTEERKPRKQSSRRHNRQKDETKNLEEETADTQTRSSQDALEVVTPEADNASSGEAASEVKPKRRRKAPARKEDDSDAIDAA